MVTAISANAAMAVCRIDIKHCCYESRPKPKHIGMRWGDKHVRVV